MTASLAGSAAGLAILWAAVAGSVLKWFLNEGIARWQMACGTTLLEGWVSRLGGWVQWVFIIYFLGWALITGGALVNACGVAGLGLWDVSGDPETSKVIWGVVHALVGLAIVRLGGFKWFARFMSVCIGVMFVSVIATAIMIDPDWAAVGSALIHPKLPREHLGWVLGVLGGVGGTVTLLSYGYWIREAGRSGRDGLRACRVDLAVGYTMTALFGLSMIIIGSRMHLENGSTALVAVALAEQLEQSLGPAGRWIFLVGFWGAIFSSLLGVWQGAPYLFADFGAIRAKDSARRGTGFDAAPTQNHEEHGKTVLTPLRGLDLARTRSYRLFLVALAFCSIPLLWLDLKQVQLAYAVLGAMFMPFLATTLLIMNNRRGWVTSVFRNGLATNIVLMLCLLFFAWVGLDQARSALAKIFNS